jgi:phosphatidylglycerol:prolipoprotein diacylglycerol transferase
VHPVFLEIPLPAVRIPLGPALLGLCVVALIVAELGRRARAWDLVALGVAGLVAALSGAASHRDLAVMLEPIPIYSFGVMLSAALVAGWFVALRLARQDGLQRDAVAGTYFTAAISGLLGARILYVLTNLGDFHSLADVLAFRNGGLVFYGAVLGGFVGSLIYLRRRRLPWLAWADVAVPSLALGSALGRIGCYLAGCDYGVPLGPRAPSVLG